LVEGEGRVIGSAEIHARIGAAWPAVLVELGVPEAALQNRHGPCPACGGKDRFRFDNKHARGDFYCNHCGAGDGFKLLMLVHGWGFAEACRRVSGAIGPDRYMDRLRSQRREPTASPSIAQPNGRMLQLWRGRCAIANCSDAMSYLDSRGLWPLPEGIALNAHASADYYEDGRRVGRFPALLADIRDVNGKLVSLHATYLRDGKKLGEPYTPRKILGPMTGRTGCALRLMPVAGTLGIAEGIETALSAALLHGVSVWAALNAWLLAKFEPPAGVSMLQIYADHDAAGLAHAARLMERLQGRVRFELRLPHGRAKDWNDVLLNRRRGGGGDLRGQADEAEPAR
jgi:putative DNA primase/helicase